MNKQLMKYQGITSFISPILAFCFVVVWVGTNLRHGTNDRLIGNTVLFVLFLVLNGMYLSMYQKLLNKGKSMPFLVWGVQAVIGGALWWTQVKYFSFAYFSLFLIYQVYQFFLLMISDEVNQNWHRIFINSFFTAIIFPIVYSQTVPFAFKLTYIGKFLPAFFLVFFIWGFDLLMTRTESRNTEFFILATGALIAALVSSFLTGKGLLYSGLLFILLAVYLLFNKKFRRMHVFTLMSCVCLVLGIILLY